MESVGIELTMGSWCVVSSSKGQTMVGGGRVVRQSRRRRQILVVVLERWQTEVAVLSSECQPVTAMQVVLVVHDLGTETVVAECQLVTVVLAVHDGGWQQH